MKGSVSLFMVLKNMIYSRKSIVFKRILEHVDTQERYIILAQNMEQI